MLSAADFEALWLDVGLASLTLLVFLADAAAPARRSRRGLAYWTFAGLVALLVASFVWPPREGLAFFEKYASDPWSLYLKQVLIAVAAIVVLGSVDHVERTTPRRQADYYLLLLFSLLGMTVLVGATDLILLVVCFELMGIPLFVLAAIEKLDLPAPRQSHPSEAAMKFFLVGVVSTPLSLFGLSLVAGLAQTTDIAALTRTEWSPLMNVGLLMIIAGMGFKVGLVPFHMWVPDTYQAAPTPFVAFLSAAPKVAGIAALGRVFLYGYSEWKEHWVPVLVVLCVMSLLLGNYSALAQRNTKRLLAYSGIGHIGYLLLGFICVDELGVATLLFYMAAYAVTNVGAFLVVEAVASRGGSDTIADFNGLAQRAPWLALAMLLFLLSLAGIPFVAGFWAKLYVFIAAWNAGFEWLVVLGALLAVVALFYYMQIARAMYMVEPEGDAAPLRVAPALRMAILLSLAGVVGFGAWPSLLLDQAHRAAPPVLAARSAPVSAAVSSRALADPAQSLRAELFVGSP